jgi:DNA-binding MarR family transcriptional regulator
MPVDVQTLGRAIKQAQYRHHRALESGLVAVGTTLAQWDALRAAQRTPGASTHELAVATFQTDQAFGALANRLVAQGLIERRAGRGRRLEHHLTDDGERTLRAGHRVADRVFTESFADLDEQERATLLSLLGRVGGTSE